MEKVLQRFLDQDYRVTLWPKKQLHKELVIEYLSSKFEFTRSYTEKEVNEILKNWHTFGDWAILRRELYERRYFDRDISGAEYKRIK